MKKVIHLSLSRRSINKAIRDIDGWKYWIERKCNELAHRLAKEGVQVARMYFADAIYSGTNDATVFDADGNRYGTAKVVAVGNSVLFIEFGTGVSTPDIHPEATENGMVRGQYGAGHGANEFGWTYYGDPGNGGQPLTKNGQATGLVHTFGDPANMPMYNTVRVLESRFENIAREVFSHD